MLIFFILIRFYIKVIPRRITSLYWLFSAPDSKLAHAIEYTDGAYSREFWAVGRCDSHAPPARLILIALCLGRRFSSDCDFFGCTEGSFEPRIFPASVLLNIFGFLARADFHA